MSELMMVRLRENLESLKMKNTSHILENYLERAVKDSLNIVEVLDHIFTEGALSKRRRAYEKQVQMSGFPIKKTLDDFDFSFQPSYVNSKRVIQLRFTLDKNPLPSYLFSIVIIGTKKTGFFAQRTIELLDYFLKLLKSRKHILNASGS